MKSKSKLVNSTRRRDARTENNAITHSTSLNSVLDLFFVAGATRNMTISQIERMLEKAWVEDAPLTLRLIFWAGDIRGGQGEREFFRKALSWLLKTKSATLIKNIEQVPEFNRWDSLFHLDHPKVMKFIHDSLIEDRNGLLAKWMPRKKQYNNFSYKFRTLAGLNDKEYRKLLVSISDTVEQKMCAKEWKKIKYSSVPSVAFSKYRKAFKRNDPERFDRFLADVEKGEETIKAGAIFPYDIYRSWETASTKDYKSIDLQWKALPDYVGESTERMLPVCDVSGSMAGLPLQISVSLGVYLSERNKSIFKDAFVTFSGKPTMEYLKGTATQRFAQLIKAHWEMNTNLSAVFELILSSAVRDKVAQADMPTTILIISDMEFDNCAQLTNYENIQEKYKASGYKTPNIVFWNVNGREGNVPVSYNDKGVALVSGSSPSIVKNLLSGKNITPVDLMLDVLNNKRYDVVKV